MLQARDVRESDWPKINHLASNAVQEADHTNLDFIWVENRRAFDGTRRHSVIESESSVVGYCSIERRPEDAPDTYRMFLVADWDRSNIDVHEALFERAEGLIKEINGAQAWMRELTDDTELVKFVEGKGFVPSPPYTWNDRELVNLAKHY